MKITQSVKNGIVCVTVKGRMGKKQTPGFENTVKKIIQSNANRLLFDLGELPYLSSSDLRVILSTVKALNRKNGKVVLCSLNGYTKEVFEVNRVQPPIAIADTVESGFKALSNTLRAA